MDERTLKQYRWLLKEIQALEQEKQCVLDTCLTRAHLCNEGRAKGGISDPVGNAIAKYDQLQQLIDKKIDELIACRMEIERALTKLQPKERTLIRLHYFRGMKWEKVAVEMSYSCRWVLKQHKLILGKLRNK